MSWSKIFVAVFGVYLGLAAAVVALWYVLRQDAERPIEITVTMPESAESQKPAGADLGNLMRMLLEQNPSYGLADVDWSAELDNLRKERDQLSGAVVKMALLRMLDGLGSPMPGGDGAALDVKRQARLRDFARSAGLLEPNAADLPQRGALQSLLAQASLGEGEVANALPTAQIARLQSALVQPEAVGALESLSELGELFSGSAQDLEPELLDEIANALNAFEAGVGPLSDLSEAGGLGQLAPAGLVASLGQRLQPLSSALDTLGSLESRIQDGGPSLGFGESPTAIEQAVREQRAKERLRALLLLALLRDREEPRDTTG